MRINGFEGVSLLDFPDTICSIVYTSPCNFKCPFCHNPALVTENEEVISVEDVIADINDRHGFIEGITITGGEPLLQPDIPEFCARIKAMGLKVKLDTNGYLPEVLKGLLDKGLVDYVAMDIKAAPDKYNIACGKKADIEKIKASIKVIMDSGINYEFRTTAVPAIIESQDMERIGELVNGAKVFSIQQFNNRETLVKELEHLRPHPDAKLGEFAEIMGKYVEKVRILNTAAAAAV